MANADNDEWKNLMRETSNSNEVAQAIKTAGKRFLAARGGGMHPPTSDEVRAYLDMLVAANHRREAHAEYAYLQMAAAELWGAMDTAFLARILRDHRVSPKCRPKTGWERVEAQIAKLPGAWQEPLMTIATASASAGSNSRGMILSASRLGSIACSLRRWSSYCAREGFETCPIGQSLKHYAEDLRSSEKSRQEASEVTSSEPLPVTS